MRSPTPNQIATPRLRRPLPSLALIPSFPILQRRKGLRVGDGSPNPLELMQLHDPLRLFGIGVPFADGFGEERGYFGDSCYSCIRERDAFWGGGAEGAGAVEAPLVEELGVAGGGV